MEVTLIGCSRLSGIGKESKKPYDMMRLLFLAPIQSFSNENAKRECSGYEQMEINVKPESWLHFLGLTYPQKGHLQLDNLPRGGKLEPVAVAFQAVK